MLPTQVSAVDASSRDGLQNESLPVSAADQVELVRHLHGEAAVTSPCINVCRMNASTGYCEGCWRTLDEIAAWGTLDDEVKRAVWQRLEQRRNQTPGKERP